MRLHAAVPLFPVVLAVPFAVCSVQAKTYTAIPGESRIIYTLKHPMHRVEGISREFECTVDLGDDTARVSIRVKAAVLSFNSGNSNRDGHALETLEAFKYPFVEFAADSVRREGEKHRVFGQLTFHGVKRALDFPVSHHADKDRVHVMGRFFVRLSDFKVERPSLMFLRTEDTLRVDIHVRAVWP